MIVQHYYVLKGTKRASGESMIYNSYWREFEKYNSASVRHYIFTGDEASEIEDYLKYLYQGDFADLRFEHIGCSLLDDVLIAD